MSSIKRKTGGSLRAGIALGVMGCAIALGAPTLRAEEGEATSTTSTPKAAASAPARPQPASPANSEPKGVPAPLPEAISSFGGAVAGDWLYVFGGHTGKAHDHSRENLSAAFRRVSLKDGGAWEDLPGGVGLQGIPLAVLDGRIYRAGGMAPRNAKDQPEDDHSTADAAGYDPAAREWKALPPLPEARSSHDMVALGGRLYVIGGWTLAGDSHDGTWLKTAWAIDPAAAGPAWTAIAEPPFQRRALALAAAGGKIYAIGGMKPDESMTTDLHIYDTVAKTWSDGPAYPGKGFGMSAIGVGDTVYASGMDGKLFALEKGAWREAGELASARFFHRLLPAPDGALVAVGGASRAGHLTDTEKVVPLPAGVRVMRFPWTGVARNRQLVFLREGAFHAFGGNNSLEQHDFAPENFTDAGFRIDAATGEAKPIAAFPIRRQSMIPLNPDGGGEGLAFGGFGHDGKAPEAAARAEIFAYDFAKDSWRELPVRLPLPLTQFGLARHDGRVWVFGGMDFDPARGTRDQFRVQTAVWAWDEKGGGAAFVDTGLKLPNPRRAFGSELLGDKFYLVGGMKANFEPVPQCDVYDFKAKAWGTIPAPGDPLISPELVSAGGKLYLAGGSVFTEKDGFQPSTAVWVFDPATGVWTNPIKALPVITRHTRMFENKGKLLLYSVHSEPARLQLIEIDPAAL